jgi:hypothetical protein
MGIAKLLVEMSDEQSHAVLFLFQSQLRVSPSILFLAIPCFPSIILHLLHLLHILHFQRHFTTLLAFIPHLG